MINKNLPIKQINNNHMEITMCGKGSCKCPSIDIDLDRDNVVIGGKEEGYTTFTKEQFELLMTEIKGGTFDRYIVKS
jgi:hypothetical protein|tara:strand:+ start:1112 stop:1342 length:231 start_codon:yes stop_codon:yes gene_type:complete